MKCIHKRLLKCFLLTKLLITYPPFSEIFFSNETADKALNRIIKDQYIENLFELVPAVKKVNPINFVELAMRAVQGTPVPRPLGSHIHFSPWEKLLFNPVHLFNFPTPENVGIQTSVTIGHRAKKPLTISIPVMIAAMSFGGALSKNAKIALAKAATMAGTATNSGEAGLLKEEREAAQLFIGQYNRGGWLNSPEKYRLLDAIEIQLGQGAQGSTYQRTTAKNIGEDYQEVFGLKDGEDWALECFLHLAVGFNPRWTESNANSRGLNPHGYEFYKPPLKWG